MLLVQPCHSSAPHEQQSFQRQTAVNGHKLSELGPQVSTDPHNNVYLEFL